MLTLNYQVAGMSITGATAPGRQVIDLTAGHIQLARAAVITGARMQVSFDDGTTWHAARVAAAGHGHFRVTFTAPARAFVTLRTSATDQAGGSIAETITRGYTTAG
jgi:predicted RNA methylase